MKDDTKAAPLGERNRNKPCSGGDGYASCKDAGDGTCIGCGERIIGEWVHISYATNLAKGCDAYESRIKTLERELSELHEVLSSVRECHGLAVIAQGKAIERAESAETQFRILYAAYGNVTRRADDLEEVLKHTQDELNAANKAANDLQMRLNDQGEDLERAGIRAGEQAEELYKANEYIKRIGLLLGSTCGDDTPERLIVELQETVRSYATSARVIALHLKEFCDESLPYDEMIADAARKAAEKLNCLEDIHSSVKHPNEVK